MVFLIVNLLSVIYTLHNIVFKYTISNKLCMKLL
jgi:hypothetical protein